MTPERWRAITEIFHAARERDPARRDAFVAEACGDDPTLRRDVEAMLVGLDAAGQFGETPLFASASQPEPASPLDVIQLTPGSQLGPYQILSLLGAGGMGQVYKARDTKLNRDVAIKVLPEAFRLDPASTPLAGAGSPGAQSRDDHLARFRREAQVLASLNHPNIGHIYGFEDSGAIHALVLELVAGPTLADRIVRGPLALADVWPIATQIAEALEAAHAQGIVHRDLKPANIKVRPDGVVKVLDFGLAKALEPTVASGAESASAPTLTSPAQMTRQGFILGTAAYMSPEQARGQAVDTRTDIWAFGCVLYETLTGRVAFKGDTVSDTIVAILDREPAWDELPTATPASARALLQRCLEKDPKRRLRDIADARLEIEQLLGRSGGGAAAPRARHWRPTYRAGLGVVALVALAAGAGLFYVAKHSGPVTSPSEYTQLTDFTDSVVAPALSPDGRMVTFIRGGEFFVSAGQIYVKLLPNGESVRLTNDKDGKYAPVFTPDGSRIAYTAVHIAADASEHWDTWTVPVLGGQPTRFLPNASGLTWIAENRVLFSEIMTGFVNHMGIVTATDTRAEERAIYFPPHEDGMAHYAYASPDRKSVLVVEMDQSHTFNQPCRLLPFDGSSAGRQVGPQGTCTSTAWSPDGTWMYFAARVAGSAHLWRQKFPDGRPEQITFGPIEEEGVALAPDGRSLVTSAGNRRSGIWIHDAAGERAISSEGYALAPRLSRDGTRVFYLLARDLVSWYLGWRPASAELRSVDLASGKTDTVLSGLSLTDYDVSRDEKEVAFSTLENSGKSQVWLAPLDRRAPPRQIARGDTVSFSADGELVFRSLEGTKNFLVRIKKDGTGRERVTTTPILDKFGVSPDGEWALTTAAAAGQDGTSGLVAVPLHGGAPRRICTDDCEAVWSSDGKFLYASIRGRTLAIPVPPGKSLPDLPASGISFTGTEGLPGTSVIEHGTVSPGPDPSTYVFVKTDLQRNLFRIPLH